jgi:outer membrane murein-binding lipoprotein Lpp
MRVGAVLCAVALLSGCIIYQTPPRVAPTAKAR